MKMKIELCEKSVSGSDKICFFDIAFLFIRIVMEIQNAEFIINV